MIALQILVNGEKIYTAGINDWDSLHAILALKNGPRGQAPSFDLNIGGTCAVENGTGPGDSVRWESRFLEVNDELSIKIVETDSADPPVKRLKREDLEQKYDPQYTREELDAMDREMYRKLKHKFEDGD